MLLRMYELINQMECKMTQDRIKTLEDALRAIVDAYEASAELHTSAADCAANLYDRACAALAASQSATQDRVAGQLTR